MRILVIATGGTIGSAFDGSAVNVQNDEKCAAASRYEAEHGDITFEIINPINILSESIAASDFNTLAGALYGAELHSFDGIILTVGSDNLGYISAFVSLILGGADIPVCLVAADKILSDERSNGYPNFCCAVELIKLGTKGIYVPYRNSDGVMYVHSAADIRQADLSDDFCSFNGAHAVYDGGLRVLRPYISHSLPAVFDKDEPPRVSDNVLLIHPYPMLDYSRLAAGGVRAVLHTLYHSSTLDSANALVFMNELGGVPFYLASLRSGRQNYRTTADMLAAGALPLYDISPECAYMKLLLACAQDKMSIEEFMEE